ncbi:hypothetical protein EYF80_002483 [Liparis tanakae]|uniref:Uncharacterized protein n=1 Tax=Liparis tanakae TaxID=230148 RepID=A0A4Z2JBB3_9TELE|nr:hypothetical protein EYF80_002483 [Liparis tanakae]
MVAESNPCINSMHGFNQTNTPQPANFHPNPCRVELTSVSPNSHHVLTEHYRPVSGVFAAMDGKRIPGSTTTRFSS